MVSTNIEITFGKHKGKKFTDIPRDYLEWLADTDSDAKEIAKAELKRRGKRSDKVKLTLAAVDKFSQRFANVWYDDLEKTKLGIVKYLEVLAERAIKEGEREGDKVKYNRGIFIFDFTKDTPTLLSVREG